MNMSREIKFRVWDKDNNKMLHYDNDIVPCLTLNGVLQDCSKEVSSNVSYKYELMQFTGLLDKNGKEIYEGDIVKSIEERGDELGDYTEELKQEVFFDGCAFYPVCTAPSENWEVIGNIYQNKTLLNI
jgi:uncharacterized phage protein (TIGR01671 family)